jgi:hypothetical protein
MTIFIQLQNGQPIGYPIAEDNFRQLFPYTSFPTYFTANTVEPLGYGIYDFSGTPDVGRYEKAVEVVPVRNEYGIWRQTYAILPMDDVEKQEVDAQQAISVRAERNRRIAATDWRVVKALEDGNGLDFDLAVYRQALRDIPEQPGFPLNITWPEMPK